MRRVLSSFGIVLTLLATVAWGQSASPTSDRWFRVSWAPAAAGPLTTIKGSIVNNSPYRVTDVRLEIEGLDADRHPVGRQLAWAIGDIAPGGETTFAAAPLPGAVSYQIRVVSYDLISRGEAQAP